MRMRRKLTKYVVKYLNPRTITIAANPSSKLTSKYISHAVGLSYHKDLHKTLHLPYTKYPNWDPRKVQDDGFRESNRKSSMHYECCYITTPYNNA